jgi:quinoprotein glucose dehydrogenase
VADENALPWPTRHYTNGSPNSWITASFDPKLNLVYIATGNNGPDIWGGNRDALVERYSSSVVALDANTGKRAWSYQTVHHDLWDMDVPRKSWSPWTRLNSISARCQGRRSPAPA